MGLTVGVSSIGLQGSVRFGRVSGAITNRECRLCRVQ